MRHLQMMCGMLASTAMIAMKPDDGLGSSAQLGSLDKQMVQEIDDTDGGLDNPQQMQGFGGGSIGKRPDGDVGNMLDAKTVQDVDDQGGLAIDTKELTPGGGFGHAGDPSVDTPFYR